MSENSIFVVVDDRERDPALWAELESNPRIRYKRQRLESGDFSVESRIIVERKTARDFAISIVQGRLFQQASKLRKRNELAYVIVEGDFKNGINGVRSQALRGALIALTVKYGLHVIVVSDIKETVSTLIYLANQAQRANACQPLSSGYNPKSKKHRQLRLLQTIPDIGPKRARLLIERFGSVREIINASEEDLLNIDGIGVRAAKSIQSLVEESRSLYGKKQTLRRPSKRQELPPWVIA